MKKSFAIIIALLLQVAAISGCNTNGTISSSNSLSSDSSEQESAASSESNDTSHPTPNPSSDFVLTQTMIVLLRLQNTSEKAETL